MALRRSRIGRLVSLWQNEREHKLLSDQIKLEPQTVVIAANAFGIVIGGAAAAADSKTDDTTTELQTISASLGVVSNLLSRVGIACTEVLQTPSALAVRMAMSATFAHVHKMAEVASATASAAASDQPTVIVYYTGHLTENGALTLFNQTSLLPSDVFDLWNSQVTRSGPKLYLVIDGCHSGVWINHLTHSTNPMNNISILASCTAEQVRIYKSAADKFSPTAALM